MQVARQIAELAAPYYWRNPQGFRERALGQQDEQPTLR
jgi:hypothetical protein